MSNNSDQKQPAYSNRRSNKNAEGRSKAGGIGNLPGLTVADTFGLVACLAILSNRVSPTQALNLETSDVKLPKLTKDLAERFYSIAGMSAETLYLSGLVTTLGPSFKS